MIVLVNLFLLWHSIVAMAKSSTLVNGPFFRPTKDEDLRFLRDWREGGRGAPGFSKSEEAGIRGAAKMTVLFLSKFSNRACVREETQSAFQTATHHWGVRFSPLFSCLACDDCVLLFIYYFIIREPKPTNTSMMEICE